MTAVKAEKYVVFVGMGDNGGDGLAIARLILLANIPVKVFVVEYKDSFSPSAEVNYNRYLSLGGKCQFITAASSLEDVFRSVDSDTVIVDAIFGIGLKGSLPEWIHDCFDAMDAETNGAKAVVAIDVPSGILFNNVGFEVDTHSGQAVVVKCEYLLTFQTPKLPFFFPEYGHSFQKMVIIDIGLEVEHYLYEHQHDEDTLENRCHFNYLPEFPTRKRGVHKGNCGHALIIAGSYGKMGAAVLATQATMRSGAGLVTAHIPKCGYNIMQISVPDAMVSVDELDDSISALPTDLLKYAAIAVGPGLGTGQLATSVVSALLTQCAPADMGILLLDADAINILAQNRELIDDLPVSAILTPHLKELERLIGVSVSDSHYTRLIETRKFCHKYLVNVVIKGPYTAVVCSNGDVYFNSSGNQGLATAGSGDVLTGIITGIFSEGSCLPAQSAIWGCYIHGLAADIMAETMGHESITASKLVDYIGMAFKRVEKRRP